jgi:hypothetical protein
VNWLAWVLCEALALLAGALLLRGSKTSPENTMFFSAPFRFPVRAMAFAPDRRTVALVAHNESARRNMLWLYEIGGAEAHAMPISRYALLRPGCAAPGNRASAKHHQQHDADIEEQDKS